MSVPILPDQLQERAQTIHDVLSVNADFDLGIERFMQRAMQSVDGKRLGVALFDSPKSERMYCCKSEACAGCGGAAGVVNFFHGLVEQSDELVGEDLLARMTPQERERMGYRVPLLCAIRYQGKLYGALTCDRDDAWQPEQLAYIRNVCDLLGVTFHSSNMFRDHAGQEEVLMRILEKLDANIYVSDMSTDEILFINRRMRDEFSLTAEQCMNKKCWQVLQDGFTGRCEFCPSYKLAQNPEAVIVWEEHNTATGMHYRNTDSVLEWIDGRLVHLQHSVNITEEKNNATQLAEAKQLAESANQAKSDFLSRMSHEIRTPINAVIGMTRIAKGSDDMEKMRQCLEKIDSSSKQLLGIINDILDMSKISANKMTLSNERFDFEHMLIDISNVISVKAGEKHQKLHICMDMDMARFYHGDELRLSQVFVNLLSNAVKFTPDGGKIRVDIHEKKREGNRSTIEASVSDSGIGISAENQKQLFNSFEQADGGIARKFGGTGLGLAICKSIVEMMGGSIRIISEEGKGSTFVFTVEMEALPDEERRSTKNLQKLDISRLRVLLIDDEPETREYFSQIMKEFRIGANTAASCDEGMRFIEQAERDKEPYGIIFVDWRMPNVDGVETLRRIKDHNGSTIVVMVSVGEMNEIEEEARAAGAARFIAKPLFPSMLVDTINEVMGISSRVENTAHAVRYSFAGYNILLAEDVEINREILFQDLLDTKVKIEYAENGRDAVEMFRSNPNKYDMILMDIHMPVMDGYDATREIRAMNVPRAREIPIIAMTANVFAEDVQRCLECGMNDHLAKPIEIEKLFAKLSYYLTEFQSKEPEKEDVTETTPTQTEMEGTTMFSNEEQKRYVDIDDALARIKGNKTIYKTLLKSFQNNNYFDQLSSEIEAGDLEAAAHTAHSIKGMAGNLSLTEIYNTVVLLEAQLKSGFDYQETFESLRQAVDNTMTCIDGVIAAL